MKLGLITDIHEHVEHLRTALGQFRALGIDQVVVIGDVFEMGLRIEETCRLLAEANAIGVWGNHDFGLCRDCDDLMRAKYQPLVLDYMASLWPRLNVEDCHFTHVEPWLNPEEVTDLWYYDGLPDQAAKLHRIFNAVPNRIMFAGHFHTWLLATPDGIQAWKGDSPIRLDHGRYYMIVGALCDGQFATFDTDTFELVPYSQGERTTGQTLSPRLPP